VTPGTLEAVGLIRHQREPIAILAEGELTKKLDVSAHRFSKAAQAKIEALGGTVTVLEFERPGRIR
jgi:large subunit ribosomal protein L15